MPRFLGRSAPRINLHPLNLRSDIASKAVILPMGFARMKGVLLPLALVLWGRSFHLLLKDLIAKKITDQRSVASAPAA
jgi:hypothetical protein